MKRRNLPARTFSAMGRNGDEKKTREVEERELAPLSTGEENFSETKATVMRVCESGRRKELKKDASEDLNRKEQRKEA